MSTPPIPRTKSLHAREAELASAQRQLEILSSGPFAEGSLPLFSERIRSCGIGTLQPAQLEIFQVNVGYMCNQVCQHCHVDAGPDRREIMTRATMEHCLEKIRVFGVKTVDITGGAPELNPDFRWFVEQLRAGGVEEIIVRCNLTIILANAKYHDLPHFFAAHGIHVVSSLPFYAQDRTDKQRGDGVFARSIQALRMLNEAGYGVEGSGLQLDLVYNPSGAFLPAAQASLEREYKERLQRDHGVQFNALFTITNMPIARFLDYLLASDNYEDYMDTLVTAFNPAAAQAVMCRNTLSVGWDGQVYDCDFNQMLGLPLSTPARHVKDLDAAQWSNRSIVVSQHCYGCTAGAGSSCQGATA